ncbi:hypothetical protein N4R57_17370 [Rhodobacteraceae bacterium D3-12]|nr:hypothetical protein N4R57_17370 [Rhodobacteraceae bacterium D3-12]
MSKKVSSMPRKKKSGSGAMLSRVQKAKAQKARQIRDLMPANKKQALPDALAPYPLVSMAKLLEQAKDALRHTPELSGDVQSTASLPLRVFFSFCDGRKRAEVVNFSGQNLAEVLQQAESWVQQKNDDASATRWLRVDWVDQTWTRNWQDVQQAMLQSKRNYFRYGIALDAGFKHAFLEQELNANAMLYLGAKFQHAGVNEKNFTLYARKRFGQDFQLPEDGDREVELFSTQALFFSAERPPVTLNGFSGGSEGRDTGRRFIQALDADIVENLIAQSSSFLADQVDAQGKFVYGIHPCFDREIDTYNTLRHTSTIYAMLEAWEITKSNALKAAIDRAIRLLTNNFIHQYTLSDGRKVAYLRDLNSEIKLGGNAVCLLSLVKFTELTGSKKYLELLEELALGVENMQDKATGQFVHVLNAHDLSVKEQFRIVYYDGEAAFGLMRLYGLTKDQRWLEAVERAFEYFIAQEHWKTNDHWLSYCVNELTLYRPDERYFQFGIKNFAGHLEFVADRITTFPTLLELMMAAHKMIGRLRLSEEHRHLLAQVEMERFYDALEKRANYLLNGFFWPEFAMFFKNPKRILGSFFIRHHSFRTRIDDVEHYLSGYVAYLSHYLREPDSLSSSGSD